MKKNSNADLRIGYRKRFEIAMLATLALLITAFYGARFATYRGGDVAKSVDLIIEVADIPQTEQIKRPPPPARPAIPVPSIDEDLPDDVTIESTELDLSELPPPPPAPAMDDDVDAAFVFVPYDEAPSMIGGLSALARLVKYPELARKAGVEGTVMIGALIDVDGIVKKTMVIKESGANVGFEQAALDAVLQTKWKPAKQRDRTVKVWMAIPVKFELRNQRKMS